MLIVDDYLYNFGSGESNIKIFNLDNAFPEDTLYKMHLEVSGTDSLGKLHSDSIDFQFYEKCLR